MSVTVGDVGEGGCLIGVCLIFPCGSCCVTEGIAQLRHNLQLSVLFNPLGWLWFVLLALEASGEGSSPRNPRL